jgi:multiple sugar transport system permease protein
LLLALLFRTIDALKVFDLVFVMTQGGPADSTNVLQFYGYKKSFAEGMIGYGSAIAVAVFSLSLLLSLLYIRLLGQRLVGEEHRQ